jgi:hypothetical protein
LDLDALGPTYPGGKVAATDHDWIDEVNPYEEEEDVSEYEDVAQALESKGYADHAYAKLIKDGSGKIWLEYWYFYYYNSFESLGAGHHEGDWESVIIGLDSDKKPDVVVFSQHEGNGRCDIDEVETATGEVPIVYVGDGSHANYPHADEYELIGGFDRADGGGWTIKPALENLGRTSPAWLEWPGHWGYSQGEEGLFQSPQGPAYHEAWNDPAKYAEFGGWCVKPESRK